VKAFEDAGASDLSRIAVAPVLKEKLAAIPQYSPWSGYCYRGSRR